MLVWSVDRWSAVATLGDRGFDGGEDRLTLAVTQRIVVIKLDGFGRIVAAVVNACGDDESGTAASNRQHTLARVVPRTFPFAVRLVEAGVAGEVFDQFPHAVVNVAEVQRSRCSRQFRLRRHAVESIQQRLDGVGNAPRRGC